MCIESCGAIIEQTHNRSSRSKLAKAFITNHEEVLTPVSTWQNDKGQSGSLTTLSLIYPRF